MHRFYIFVKDRRGDTSFVFSILNNYLYYVKETADHPQDTGAFSNDIYTYIETKKQGAGSKLVPRYWIAGFTGFAVAGRNTCD
jgi:hypothetical protein